MGRKILYALLFMAFFAVTQCVEPYNPPAIKDVVDILVVDGFMNCSDSSVEVRLSKAVPLSDPGKPLPEVNATVWIEDENGNQYNLSQHVEGTYSAAQIPINTALKYRLNITTQNETTYQSAFIRLTATPPIDNISWRKSLRDEGIDILLNSHDPSGSTQYYQWTYQETWEYTSPYFSAFKIIDGVVIDQPRSIFRCWTTQPSTQILIGTTTQLADNVIRDYEVLFVPIPSLKMSQKFSVEVEQRAITKEAYDFWLQLKKTTESLGSLFDPLPSQVTGNITNKNDSSQPVLGYFSGGTVSKKRIYIRYEDLPEELRKFPRTQCPIDSIGLENIASYSNLDLINSYGFPFIQGYTTSQSFGCLDCRERGGKLERPEFWE